MAAVFDLIALLIVLLVIRMQRPARPAVVTAADRELLEEAELETELDLAEGPA